MIDAELGQIILILPLSALIAWGFIRLTFRHTGQPDKEMETGAEKVAPVLIYQRGVLVDANPDGHSLLLASGEEKAEWTALASQLAGRFPGFPQIQESVERRKARTFAAHKPDDQGFVVLEQWDDMARITLRSKENGSADPEMQEFASPSEQVIAEAPYPIWQTDGTGRVVWANSTYFDLAENLGIAPNGQGNPAIFDLPAEVREPGPYRTAVTSTLHGSSHWFDISLTESDEVKTFYATDANAIVNAEIAQRNFVQTLTKTFAQLSAGLAIFDRNRQLALFNPALIDLTALPADFLSSRPNLLTFFDRMRENRMMPEPRNYASWREQIAELVVAASDDRYTETWTLPSGVTYRVLGRPHPDGAIAFLFEDISAEVSLTRRFRSDLELGQAALDSVREAVAVFSPTGKLSFCNLAYRTFWESEPELGVTEYSLNDAMQLWRANSEKSEAWEKLRHHVLDFNPRESWTARMVHTSGKPFNLTLVSLSGGYTSVLFQPDAEPVLASSSAEMMTG